MTNSSLAEIKPGNKRSIDATKREYQRTNRLLPWAYRRPVIAALSESFQPRFGDADDRICMSASEAGRFLARSRTRWRNDRRRLER